VPSSSDPVGPVPLFRDLGDLRVEVHGRERGPGGRRPAALLAALLVHANERVPVDLLGAAVWPDGPPRSTSTLESHLWRLRQVLEPEREPGRASSVLRTEPGGYRLVVATGQVDSLRFAELARDTDRRLAAGRADEALVLAERARPLWRGRPFAAVADQPWAAPAVARLEGLRNQLVERHVEALLETGRADAALVELEAALSEHPLRERLWTQVMVASYRAGRVDEALAAYTRARAVLREELGTEPGEELRETHRRVLAADPALLGSRTPLAVVRPDEGPLPTLPQWSTSLVGRDDDVARVRDLLPATAVVTLCGPAGVGKTRLAVEIAREAAPAFPDGVRFVDLTGTRDGRQVVDAVTSALALAASPAGSAIEALAAFLRDREVLLVLDDCEHVVDEVARVAEDLGREAPAVRLLVTSRQQLEVRHETVVDLAPLAVPDDDEPDGPALELFLDRWADGRHPTPAADDLVDVRRVCRAVDGVPLALELAAARARTFSLAEVAEQSEQDPSALSGLGRRRRAARSSVFDAVARSYDLLDAEEQRLHRALSVLPGPFTAAAAAAVAGTSVERVADLLADLTHRSLLSARRTPAPGRPTRFSQLTIVRAHAGRALDTAEESTRVRDRRVAWFLDLVAHHPRLGDPAERAWSDAIADDLPTLRAVLHETLVERPSALGVRVIAGLGTMFWYQRDATLEGRRWIELAGEVAGRVDVPASTGLRLAIDLATIRAFAGRADLASPVREHVLAELAHLDLAGDEAVAVGDAVLLLAVCLGLAGDAEQARTVLEVAESMARRTGDRVLALLCRTRVVLSEVGRRAPDAVFRDAVSLHADAEAVDNRFAAWLAAGVAHMAAHAAGDGEVALHWSDVCLLAVRRTGRRHAPFQLELRANTLSLLGRHAEARRLYDAARVHVDRAGLPWPSMPGTAPMLERTRAAVPETPGRAGDEDAHLVVHDLLRSLEGRASA
jgi:predicted ATPase/DNA-binding SARP family transcriptional activator